MTELVIVPTFNEAENIDEMLRLVRAVVPSADILVVDDNSPDGTAAIANAVAVDLGRIDVLQRERKGGLGSAYRAGFARGLERGYDVLLEIDADLSHDPAVIPELLAAVDRGADVAIGSRYVPGGSVPYWPWHRRFLSRYGNKYASFVLRLGIRDATAGFRAYTSHALQAISAVTTHTTGYGFQIEMTYRATNQKLEIVEVPIEFRDRVRGTSKMSGRIVVEAMLQVTLWGLGRPFRRRSKPSADPNVQGPRSA